jgi:putative hydrolase of the HAD superfamily
MPPLDAICFDLDATLVDFDGAAIAQIVAGVCAEIAPAVGLDASLLEQHHSSISPEDWRAWGATLGQPAAGSDRTGMALMRGSWQKALLACGCGDETLAERAFQLYWSRTRSLFRPFDDAMPLLKRLHGSYKLAVVTNGPADTQLDKLTTAGLDGYFDVFVASGGVGVAKPDAGIFRHALDQLGVEAETCLHVGDWLPADVAGALNAGLTAVWLNRRGQQREPSDPTPHHEIASLAELVALLDGEIDKTL